MHKMTFARRLINKIMQTNLFMKSALLVEQNPIQAKLYSNILSANGFEVNIALSITEGIMKIKIAILKLVVA